MQNIKKTYHIITLGCAMNQADGERIASYLGEFGCLEASERKDADFVVLVTCGIRQSAEDRIYGLVPRIRKENKDVKIILAGCLSQRPDVIKRLQDMVDVWLPINDLPTLAESLGLGKSQEYKNYLNISQKHSSPFSAFVPIGNGCNNFCSYCVVPYARGREVYREAEEIISDVKELLKNGYKEITLIAQNVNSYFSKSGDTEIDFADLLKMVNDLPGDFWLRFSTSHPKDMSTKLIETIAECEKVCEHVHLPAQAGDNDVLKSMNRRYTIEHYKGLIKKIKTEVAEKKPDALPVSFSTDVIVGFPGETEAQFEKTADLFREMKYDIAFVSQYSPRYGTVSAGMKDDVSPEEKKRREDVLMVIVQETQTENNKYYLNRTVEVLFESFNKKKGTVIGKMRTGKIVKLFGLEDKKDELIGEFGLVEVVKVDEGGFTGQIIKN